MGPVPIVDKSEQWTRHAREVANASARLPEDDGHLKVKVSSGLVPTNALLVSYSWIVGSSEANAKLLSLAVKSW